MPIAIVGATGATGGLAFEIAEARGLEPIAVGRNRSALVEFLAKHQLGENRMRVANVHDASALRSALQGVSAVISTVSPFYLNGFAVARTAAEMGLGYADSTGEGKFAVRLASELDALATRSGATLCTGDGASAFLGDVATQFLLRENPDAQTGAVVYDIQNYKPTFGSLISYLGSILPSGGTLIRRGNVEFQPFASFAGEAAGFTGWHAVMIDPVVVSRYWRPERFDALQKAGSTNRRTMQWTMAAVATAPARWLLMKLPLRRMGAFDRDADARATVTAHAEIITRSGEKKRLSVTGNSVYFLTAAVLVATIQAMLALAARPVGVRAASEMFTSLEQALKLAGLRRQN